MSKSPTTIPDLTKTSGMRKHSAAVRKARERLQADADEIYTEYRKAIQIAVAGGEYEPALKAYQHLLDHLPAEEGQRLLDPSVDKQQVTEGPRGPLIQIGIIQGGVPQTKALPDIITIDTEMPDGPNS